MSRKDSRGGFRHRAEVPHAVHRAFLHRAGGGAGRAGRAGRRGRHRLDPESLFHRRSVAAALNLDLNRVQIIQATLGGSFGGKDEVMTSMCCRAALLALKTGKPVKMVNTREESMLESYKRHPYVLYYKWGAKKDGSITAMEIRCIADGGAYASMSPFVTWRSVVQATGPYYCENVKTDVFAVYTNNNYTGAMRGFGSPQVNFAIESMMDELAEKVGKNPLEIRLQNGFEDGAVTATGQKA